MKYRKIDPRIWNDAKFRELSDRGKLVFLFLLTHPHMTSLGAMRATIPGLAAELGWTEKAFREAFREAFLRGMVRLDEKAHFLGLPNFLKYNPPESPNVIKAWQKCLDDIPECDMKNEWIQMLKGYAKGYTKAFREAFEEAFRKNMPNQEQEQEQEYNILSSSPELDGANSPGSDSRPKDKIPYKSIIDHLNATCGTNYRHTTEATRRLIRARWNEGWREDDFRYVIDLKAKEWGRDEKMVKFLRPQTLFGTKFESYRQQRMEDLAGRTSGPVYEELGA